jgi:pyruvate ferredoxin oxidoreductase alpha subunit
MDRSDSCSGAFSPLYSDVAASLYAAGVVSPKMINCIYGIGGREISTEHITDIYEKLGRIALGAEKPSDRVEYVNVRIN